MEASSNDRKLKGADKCVGRARGMNPHTRPTTAGAANVYSSFLAITFLPA